MKRSIDERSLAAIEDILGRGGRVEIIQTKEGVKIFEVKRREVKPLHQST